MQSILSIVASTSARVASQPDPAHPIWRIDDPGLLTRDRRASVAAVESCRKQLLDVLLAATPHVYLLHNDDPVSEGIPGYWEPAGNGSWRLPPNVDQDDETTQYWLRTLGNWIIFSAASPIDEPAPDPFRAPRSLLDWMSRNGVEVLLSAYADASEWILALNEAAIGRATPSSTEL